MFPLGVTQKAFAVLPGSSYISNKSAVGAVTFGAMVSGTASWPEIGCAVTALVAVFSAQLDGNPPLPPEQANHAKAAPLYPMQSFVTGDGAKSAAVTVLKVGAAAAPLAGPMKNVFALWLASAPVSVPLLVTGDPLTVKIEGSDSATLDTVPEPEPQDCHSITLPFVPKHCPLVPNAVKPVPPLATGRVPAKEIILFGHVPVIEMFEPPVNAGVPVPVPPFARESTPVTPPFPEIPTLMAGISGPAKGRKLGTPAAPVGGPAKIVFVFSLTSVPVRVPELVTGVPVTAKIDGKESPTLVSAPRPDKVAGPQVVPFHSSICPGAGATDESGRPSRPITVWLDEVPLKSPLAMNKDAGPQEPHIIAVPLEVKHCPLVPTVVSPVPPFTTGKVPEKEIVLLGRVPVIEMFEPAVIAGLEVPVPPPATLRVPPKLNCTFPADGFEKLSVSPFVAALFSKLTVVLDNNPVPLTWNAAALPVPQEPHTRVAPLDCKHWPLLPSKRL